MGTVKNKTNYSGLPSLKELLSIKDWQKIQDNFATVTAIGLRTLDSKGNPVNTPSMQPRLCTDLLKVYYDDQGCWCLPTFLGGKAVVDKNLSYSCTAGKLAIHNFVVPLALSKRLVLGYIIVGPVVLIMRKSKEDYRQAAEQLNLDLETLWGALLELKVVSFHGVRSLLELLKQVGEYTIALAYENLMRKRHIQVTPLAYKMQKLPNALLDVAFEITKADIGSIMFFDDEREKLTIRASKGIPEEIVKNTTVKPGDRISGIAAKEGVSFLLDDKISDNRVKPYLNRPQISSSMVLPVKVKDEILGVMNLGVLRSSPVRFTNENLGLMQKLVDLATVAWRQ